MKRKKNGEYTACLKFSVPIFVEQIYKMQGLEVSGAVRPIYGSLGVRQLMPVPKVTLSETTFRIEVYKEKYSWSFLFTVFIQLKSTFMLTTVC